LLTFEEWGTDRYFYDHLTDGRETEVQAFLRMKKLMDLEELSAIVLKDEL